VYVLDGDGRMTGITHKDGLGIDLVDYVNTFDDEGRILSETRNSVTKTFAYDTTGQVTDDGTNSYTYDDNGNRTMTGYTTGVANRITSDGVWNYCYDAEGNVISKERISDGRYWSYSYDHRNQLRQAVEYVSNGGTMMEMVDYVNDVFGNMTQRVITPAVGPAETVKLAYEITVAGTGITRNANTLWAELDGNDNLQVQYLSGQSGEALARSGPGIDTAYLLADRLGSIREMTNSSGVIVKELEYDGFGNIVSESGSANRGNMQFCGYWYDGSVNQYVAHWRMLNPDNGQWSVEDPIEFAGEDANVRRYVENNGLNYSDSDGLFKEGTAKPGAAPPDAGTSKSSPQAGEEAGNVKNPGPLSANRAKRIFSNTTVTSKDNLQQWYGRTSAVKEIAKYEDRLSKDKGMIGFHIEVYVFRRNPEFKGSILNTTGLTKEMIAKFPALPQTVEGCRVLNGGNTVTLNDGMNTPIKTFIANSPWFGTPGDGKSDPRGCCINVALQIGYIFDPIPQDNPRAVQRTLVVDPTDAITILNTGRFFLKIDPNVQEVLFGDIIAIFAVPDPGVQGEKKLMHAMRVVPSNDLAKGLNALGGAAVSGKEVLTNPVEPRR